MSLAAVSLVAFLPAVALCLYVYAKDKIEKEPAPLVIALFLTGAVSFVLAFFCQKGVSLAIDSLFKDYMSYNSEGVLSFGSKGAEILHAVLISFFGISIVGQALKWLPVFVITTKSRHFNCLFDGIVYFSSAALGFAAAESFYYGATDGWDTLFLRLMANLPLHLFLSIISGFCLSVFMIHRRAKQTEKQLFENGEVSKKVFVYSFPFCVLSVAIPSAMQGLWQLSQMLDNDLFKTVFVILSAALYVVCFVFVNRLSSKDGANEKFADRWLVKRHPHLDIVKLSEDDGVLGGPNEK